MVSGGLDTERIGYFMEAGAPVDSFAVGSAISDASPVDFTGDLKEIDGRWSTPGAKSYVGIVTWPGGAAD